MQTAFDEYFFLEILEFRNGSQLLALVKQNNFKGYAICHVMCGFCMFVWTSRGPPPPLTGRGPNKLHENLLHLRETNQAAESMLPRQLYGNECNRDCPRTVRSGDLVTLTPWSCVEC